MSRGTRWSTIEREGSERLARRMAIRGGISMSQAREWVREITGIMREGTIRDGRLDVREFLYLEVRPGYVRRWNPKRHRNERVRGRTRIWRRCTIQVEEEKGQKGPKGRKGPKVAEARRGNGAGRHKSR